MVKSEDFLLLFPVCPRILVGIKNKPKDHWFHVQVQVQAPPTALSKGTSMRTGACLTPDLCPTEHQPDEQFHPCGIFRASRPSGYPLPSVSGDLLRDSGVEPGPHHPDRGGVTPPLPHVFLPRSSLCLGDHDHIPYRPRDALGVGCSLGCRQHLWLHVLPSSSCTLLWAPQSLHWWERWLWTVTWLSVTP